MVLPKGSTLPTSRRTRLLHLLRSHHAARGEPLAFADLLAAYRSRYGEPFSPDALHAPLGALLHSGEVVRVGRHGRRVTYQAVLPAVDSRLESLIDREMRVMERRASSVVADLYRRHRVPIPTTWISGELKRRNLWPDRFQRLTLVLTRLEQLSPADGDRAELVGLRRMMSRSLQGLPKVAWIPATARGSHGTVPRERADTLRRAVKAAAKGAGRPISRRELRWWLSGQSLEAGQERMLGALLKSVAYRDAASARDSAIGVVTGPLSCHGGAAARYHLGSPSSVQRDACRITDASVALRVADELASLQAARHELSAPSDALGGFVAIRTRLLAHAWHAHAGGEPAEALKLAIRAATAIAAWGIAEPRASDGVRQARGREAARVLADLRASEGLLESEYPRWTSSSLRPRGVGEAATVSLHEVREFADMLAAAGELRVARLEKTYATAKRFPVRGAQPSTLARSARRLSPGDRLAVVDRVDAISDLVHHLVAARAASLVNAAAGLLGHVMRDAATVTELLDGLDRESTPRNGAARRAVVVALGMLGAEVEAERAIPPGAVAEDGAAFALSVLCRTWQPKAALEQLGNARGTLPPAVLAELEAAEAALRAGRFFSVLERTKVRASTRIDAVRRQHGGLSRLR